VAVVKARPGRFNYGVSTTQTMLTAEVFKRRAGMSLARVLYRGEPQVVSALLAGEVDMAVSTPTAYRPMLDAGRVRPLAVTTAVRSPLYPDVPTLEEAGFPDSGVAYSNGIWAPAGTPRAVIDRLNTELAAVLQLPEVQKYFRSQVGAIAAGSTPQNLLAAAERELRFYGDAARLVGFEPE